eukprot:1160971-Pelagomonas_calceolata.AAC.7
MPPLEAAELVSGCLWVEGQGMKLRSCRPWRLRGLKWKLGASAHASAEGTGACEWGSVFIRVCGVLE